MAVNGLEKLGIRHQNLVTPVLLDDISCCWRFESKTPASFIVVKHVSVAICCHPSGENRSGKYIGWCRVYSVDLNSHSGALNATVMSTE